jgi:hypothetical protein
MEDSKQIIDERMKIVEASGVPVANITKQR